MKLDSPFVQLDCLFDKDRLQKEVAGLPESAWQPHPQGFTGNSAVPLVARDGNHLDDRTHGPMLPTEWLKELPYIEHILSSLHAPIGRSRLMRIQGKSQVPSHTDLDYYWQRRMRIHVPIITSEGVRFECGDAAVNMAAGEAWVFDTTLLHRVLNPEGCERIHLVVDTVGSEYLFGLFGTENSNHNDLQVLNRTDKKQPQLRFERHNRPAVMSPHEQREILTELLQQFATEHDQTVVEHVASSLQPILHEWNAVWAEHGHQPSGINSYQTLLERLKTSIDQCTSNNQFRGAPMSHWLRHWLVAPALKQNDSDNRHSTAETEVRNPVPEVQNSTSADSSEVKYTSQYTETLPGLIAHLAGTLVATTYASNRVVLLRSEGAELNTHFKEYTAAMGLAHNGSQIALGAQNAIWLFRSQPDLGPLSKPNCDAVYVPFKQHITGDIRVHELGWSEDELWVVNTRFSCLATLDDNHSFVPRWHPNFIDKLNAEDACHLNGMAMRDNKPAWVSALGVSAEAGGWRANKLNGGVLIDVASGEIATEGLCMPHSPRWHADSLWVLDSGRGELCQVDPNNGNRQTVARLPGFTRGLAMVDRYAFIGCSRVREAAWFGGLPILNRDKPPLCGIWAVDLISGDIIGWLKFEEGIDEIFDLQWLPHLHWPDILEPNEPIARNGFTLPADKLSRFIK